MKRLSIRAVLARLRVFAAAFLAIAALTVALRPQTISIEHARALDEIGGYLVEDAAAVDKALHKHGFDAKQHVISDAAWDRMPTVRKLNFAYVAAERAQVGGGEKLLALMSRDLAMQYDSVQRGVLAEFAQRTVDQKPSFVRVDGAAMEVRLDLAHDRALGEMARHFERGTLGGTEQVMREYFGLSDARARELLRSSDSVATALKRGFEEVPQARRDAELKLLTHDVQKVRYEARVSEVLNGVHRWTGEVGLPPHGTNLGGSPEPPHRGPAGGGGRSPTGNGGGSTGPGSPRTGSPGTGAPSTRVPRPLPSARGAADSAWSRSGSSGLRSGGQRYLQFLRNSYQPSGRSFRGMIRMRGGFGGVIFGNQFKVDGIKGSLVWVEWIPDRRGGDAGRLEFHLEDGSTLGLNSVLAELVAVAHRMVFEGIEGAEPVKGEVGVGLVGVTDSVPWVDFTAAGVPTDARHWNVIMHPALIERQLGWAAIHVDVLPIAQQELLRLVKANAGQDLALVQAWLDLEPATWKFVDASLEIGAEGARLMLRRQGAEAAASATGLVSGGGLDMQGFWFSDDATDDDDDENQVDPEKQQRLDQAFRAALPGLLRASADFERLEQFAGVFAIMRWIRDSGAECVRFPSVGELASWPTPAGLITSLDSIAVAGELTFDEGLQLYRARLEAGLPQERQRLPAPFTALAERLESGLAALRQLRSADPDNLTQLDLLRATRVMSQFESAHSAYEKELQTGMESWAKEKGHAELAVRMRAARLAAEAAASGVSSDLDFAGQAAAEAAAARSSLLVADCVARIARVEPDSALLRARRWLELWGTLIALQED